MLHGSPHFARRVHHELKLLALLVHGKQISGGHGGETALRAERQVLERHEPGSLSRSSAPCQAKSCEVGLSSTGISEIST